MITKYIVRDDNIFLYENEDLVCTLPNNEDNLKLAKLYNDQVFVDNDIKKVEKICSDFNKYLKKEAFISLGCFIIFILIGLINLPVFINYLAFFILIYNVVGFMVAKGKLESYDRKLGYFNRIKKQIEDKIEECINSKCKNKVDNIQLTFSDDQMVSNHKKWLEDIGEFHSYADDYEIIKNNKVLVKQ